MSTECGCHVNVTGPLDDLKRFFAIVDSSRDGDEDGWIHLLSTIDPMPEELVGICMGSAVIQGKRYERWYQADGEKPARGIAAEEQRALTSTFGFPDWYLWRSEHWGPRYGTDLYTEMKGTPQTGLVFAFTWPHPFPPLDFVGAIAEKWPRLRFCLSYCSETGESGEMEMLGGTVVRHSSGNINDDLDAQAATQCNAQKPEGTAADG